MKKKRAYQFGLADILFCTIFALCIIAVQALLTSLFENPVATGIFLFAIYAAGIFVFLYLRRRPSETLSWDDSLSKVASVLSDAVLQMDIPAVICPADADRIIWHNKAADFLLQAPGRKLISASCFSICQMQTTAVSGGSLVKTEFFSPAVSLPRERTASFTVSPSFTISPFKQPLKQRCEGRNVQ